ncbi:hypothetical protein [Hydrogenophaga sp. T2]|uniref:hypothetical protein n=1 Tax=Hydrogenophaga sp. T2 TaxID=3132823 RepID=UPI003CEB23A2
MFAALLGALQPAPARASGEPWAIEYTERLGAQSAYCFGKSCRAAEQQYAATLLRVCINRDPKTAGFFTQGDWVVSVGPDGPATCRERLHADPAKKILYLQANFLGGTRLDTRAPATIRCEPNPPGQVEYNPCESAFFTPNPSNPRFMFLNGDGIHRVVRDAKVVDSIERYLREEDMRRAEQQRAQYLADFQNAKGSLIALRAFEQKYRGDDPDRLIEQLADVRRELQLQEYRDRYAQVNSTSSMLAFIEDYRDNDPEGKVPGVRRRLDEEMQRQRDLEAAETKRKEAEELQSQLAEIERDIIWCKRRTQAARQVIAREEEIGRISGFVNKRLMREAGEQIVACEENNPKRFAEYQRRGGRKSYAQLQ